jgi:hypothetical protein
MICVNIFVFLLLVNGILCHSKTKRMHMRCRPRMGISIIHVLGCDVVKVRSKGCDGHRSSSAIPKITGAGGFAKTCLCCFPTKSTIKYVKLQCADGKKKTMALPQATRCKCRPC